MAQTRLLAFETATAASSVALLDGETLISEERGATGSSATESLMPALDRLLSRTGQSLDSVDAFAVSIGPGSFTGLRVGVATVKGLAFGTRRPVVAVPTLAALARNAAPGGGPVVATLDARRDEVYAAAYPGDAPQADPALPEGVYTLEELLSRLPPVCRVVGEGVSLWGEHLKREGLSLGPSPDPPRASHVGVLGARLLAAGAAVKASALVPRYLRRAQAEVVRTGRRFESEG